MRNFAYAARVPKRYSNLALALVICIPMVITGIFVGRCGAALAGLLGR